MFNLSGFKFLQIWKKREIRKIFPTYKSKKNKKKSIRRYWIESQGELLLFADLHSKKKLSGIYELPFELPESITYDPKAHEPIGIRKRTIGNVDYQEEIIRITNFESNHDEIENGYIWANREKINNLPYPAPTENGSINWDADRLLRVRGSPWVAVIEDRMPRF